MTDYPRGMELRPLTGWPRAYTAERRRAPFSATWTTTIRQLDYELYQLGPINGGNAPSVLQVAIDEAKFRRDGMPRADATHQHPGVILNIESRHGALSYPCDTFTRWQDNLRAITLALEALRKVDRYGVTQTGEQYRGWRAIEAKPASVTMTRDQAVAYLATVAGVPAPTAPTTDGIATLYRAARRASHPDRNSGDQSTWDKVEAAGRILTTHTITG